MDKNIIIESKVELLNSKEINRRFYEKPGVWALYGRKNKENWKCLEVAKTTNMFSEILSAIYILITPDDNICVNCNNQYLARRRFGNDSAKFYIHKCKTCTYISSLRTKSWKRNPRYIDKYRDMLTQDYFEFRFLCVDMSDDMLCDKKRRTVERRYAIDNKALYWWG